jgi:hypothetical protein
MAAASSTGLRSCYALLGESWAPVFMQRLAWTVGPVKTPSLGIRHYRWGGFPLDAHKSIPAQIDEDRGAVRDLAELNRSFGVCAMYHTHSGPGVLGASIWDLYLVRW